MDKAIQMTIGGERVSGAEGYDIINPATEKVFAVAPDCTEAELDSAVKTAREAFPDWKALSMNERRKYLMALATKIGQHGQELAKLLTQEQGHTAGNAMADIMGGVMWLSQTPTLELASETVIDTDDRGGVTIYEPIGVVAGFVPWNFPIGLAMFKVAPALLAGNTMVLKPAPTTPLATLRLGEIAQEVLPPGVLNVVSGSDRLGPWLSSHEGVDKVSFTGSTRTGRLVMASAAPTLKRVTLELGGNDPAIVLPDVDVDEIAEKLFWGACRFAGQACIAVKRLYIHEDVYEPMKAAFVALAEKVKIGPGSDPTSEVGPVQNKAQYDRLLGLLSEAREQEYDIAFGGEPIDRQGYFIPVTIIDNPPEESRIVQEEQFGPIIPLIKYSDLDDAIERANATQYGLGASVWTKDLEQAEAIAARLDAGTVWINDCVFLSPLAAFGGHKQSGIGIEGSVDGLKEFSVTKTIFTKRK